MTRKIRNAGVAAVLASLWLFAGSAGARVSLGELRERAEAGEAAAEAELGMRYYQGTGVRKDGAEARKWLQRAAEQGDARAQYNLGFFHQTGVGGDPDFEQAIEWYGRAEASGFGKAREARLKAIVNHGLAFETGETQPRDLARAAELYREAAEGGNAIAQYNLGQCLTFGKGVDRDYVEAGRWLRAAEDQGYANATKALEALRVTAALIPEGTATPAAGGASESTRRRAEAGDADAQYELAWMLRSGLGVDRDDREARRFLRAAAEQGHAHAQAELALMYHSGDGVARDYEISAAWYRKAAEQGHTGAQSSLGAMLVNGEGIPVDLLEGLKWTYVSYAAEHMSRYMIFRLERELDAESFAEGRRRADAWFAARDRSPTRYGPEAERQPL